MKTEVRKSNRSPSEEKPSTILAAALDLFAVQGFHATNVPMIAEKAGVAVGTLYHHFANKEAIANELYCRLRRELDRAVYRDLPAGVPPYEQFKVIWRRTVAFALAKPSAFRFLEMHYHDAYLDESSHALNQQIRGKTQNILIRGRLAQILKPVHSEVLAAFIEGSLKHLVQAAQADRIQLTDEVIDEAAACCWAAIKEGWIQMEKFTLSGETGQVSLSFEYVQCGTNDCDCRGTVSIASWGMQAQGKAWFTIAAVAKFYRELHAAYEALDGSVAFVTYEETLKLAVTFERGGQVVIAGTFREPHNTGNELQFRIVSDQSYVTQTLEQLAELVDRYSVTA